MGIKRFRNVINSISRRESKQVLLPRRHSFLLRGFLRLHIRMKIMGYMLRQYLIASSIHMDRIEEHLFGQMRWQSVEILPAYC
jgi:hypothetical protein